MKKVAVILSLVLLLAMCPLHAAAYSDSVVSFDVPGGFYKNSDIGNQYMHCWVSGESAFYLIEMQNINHQPTARLTKEEKEKFLESSNLGLEMSMGALGNGASTTKLASEDVTINGYEGLKMTTTLQMQSGYQAISAPIELYYFATQEHLILFQFLKIGSDSDFQKAKSVLNSLKIYEPIIYGSAGAKGKDGLSTGMIVLICVLGGVAVGGLIGLAVVLTKKKKKRVMQMPFYGVPQTMPQTSPYGVPTNTGGPQMPPYGMPMNPQTPPYEMPANPQTAGYGVPQTMPQTPPYGAPTKLGGLGTDYGLPPTVAQMPRYDAPPTAVQTPYYGVPQAPGYDVPPTVAQTTPDEAPLTESAPETLTGSNIENDTKGEDHNG
ncbi:MAG: hypothetical protein IJL52_04385 [Clostridia bacterium]|nr:hypothetical protein [Clostridia bacterium]